MDNLIEVLGFVDIFFSFVIVNVWTDNSWEVVVLGVFVIVDHDGYFSAIKILLLGQLGEFGHAIAGDVDPLLEVDVLEALALLLVQGADVEV